MDSLTLNTDYTLLSTENYAESAITSNPRIKWIKFVFTDDQPNANKERITQAEFAEIIKSGVNMPIKMQRMNPEGQHALSVPIGVIANLTKQDNKVLGLGALWMEEFPEDIKVLESAHAEGKPLNLSWEIIYSSFSEDENGVKNLIGTNVRAITFVGSPAYDGRTGVISMAEKTKPEQQEDIELGNSNETTDLNVQKVADLETTLAEVNKKLSDTEASLETANKELEDLRKYKQDREAADLRVITLEKRRKALSEAGIQISDEDFQAKAEQIVQMTDDMFNFFAQELVAFAKKSESSAETHTNSAPDLTSGVTNEDPASILKSAFVPKK